MRTRRAIPAALAAVAALTVTGLGLPAAAAPTQVGTVANADLVPFTLVVTAAPGKANNIRVEQVRVGQTDRFIVSDTADVVVPRGSCKSIPNNSHAVDCPAFFPQLHGGDGNDIVTFDNDIVPVGGTQIPALLFGEAGNDLVQATPNSWTVSLHGGPGNDSHRGGRGNDDLDGGPGPDGFYGGGGRDVVDYSSRTTKVSADLDGVQDDGELNERDVIKTDVEGFRGGSAGDTLIGNESANSIFGGPGNDTIFGFGGADFLIGNAFGNDGDDTIFGGNGPDEIQGGAGNDGLDGGAGNDHVSDQSGIDRLLGGAGADRLEAEDGSVGDFLEGGADTTDTCDIDIIGTLRDGVGAGCEIVF
ncbi:calcium-binding protein [Tenggerimyces flavus]|uniref:Calcium-binding protein n=1 Tax=Tenggerimyces flavus TaxID=1708749 RepID=A0ABV7Y9Z3_9ACTN|nr:calcium-binding protein [Tenggerimyces flavus]MBM7785310.1 Ca2+-binding RTX toxin-like protein [Tenggerimyces flavus]